MANRPSGRRLKEKTHAARVGFPPELRWREALPDPQSDQGMRKLFSSRCRRFKRTT